MSGNATVQSFLVTSPKMMDCTFGTAILLAGPTESSQNWPTRNLQNSSAEFLQKSPFKSELAKLLGEALLKTRSALWLSLGQLCRLPRAAEHASRSCSDLHGAPVQNLVVPINDCQQRMPHNAHLRIGFISCR